MRPEENGIAPHPLLQIHADIVDQPAVNFAVVPHPQADSRSRMADGAIGEADIFE
ncbi:hypothetical protein D3C76_1627600 [compost metagenome]